MAKYGSFADDIAVDWISSKLYWTESGLQNRIRVLDLLLGHVASVVNLGENINPRAIVVDPINKYVPLKVYHMSIHWLLSMKVMRYTFAQQL